MEKKKKKKRGVESLLPFPTWRAGNISLFFSPISPHFYPVILNYFADKLNFYFLAQILFLLDARTENLGIF
jgi:hypothetical protein